MGSNISKEALPDFKSLESLRKECKAIPPKKLQEKSGSFGDAYEVQTYCQSDDGRFYYRACVAKVISKDLHESDSTAVNSRYIQECKFMSELSHPNITKFVGVCFLPQLSRSLPVLLTEMLSQSLDCYLMTDKDIFLSRKISILQDIARGLAYLHEQTPPIVHRDLTSTNVLLTKDLEAKITDYSNSRIVNPRYHPWPTQATYMPPDCDDNVPSLDIFSFGHLALYVITQELPSDLKPASRYDIEANFPRAYTEVERRRKYFDILEKILSEFNTTEDSGDTIRMKPDQRENDLKKLLEKCLSNNPKERYTADDLKKILAELNSSTLLKEWAKRWEQDAGRRSIKLIVTGKPGAGKSTLVNNFLGMEHDNKEAARVDAGANAVTDCVSDYERTVNGVTVKIIDTPGLVFAKQIGAKADTTVAMNRCTLALVNAYTDEGKADLLLYCMAMVGSRASEEEHDHIPIIRKLTKRFGDQIWERALLILTVADVALENCQNDLNKYDEAIESNCKAFKNFLAKAGVSKISAVRCALSMKSEPFPRSTLIAIPTGRITMKNEQIPRDWKSLLFDNILKKCDIEAVPQLLVMQGIALKKFLYYLSMNYAYNVSNFGKEDNSAAADNIMVNEEAAADRKFVTSFADGEQLARIPPPVVPSVPLPSRAIAYATILKARSLVANK